MELVGYAVNIVVIIDRQLMWLYCCHGYGCHGYSCHGYGCHGYGCHGYGCHGYSCHGHHGCHGYGCHGYNHHGLALSFPLPNPSLFLNRFYPYHYAPFVSDIKNMESIEIQFHKSTPLLPFQQLLAVLPPASKFLLPQCYQVNESLIKSFQQLLLHVSNRA